MAMRQRTFATNQNQHPHQAPLPHQNPAALQLVPLSMKPRQLKKPLPPNLNLPQQKRHPHLQRLLQLLLHLHQRKKGAKVEKEIKVVKASTLNSPTVSSIAPPFHLRMVQSPWII